MLSLINTIALISVFSINCFCFNEEYNETMPELINEEDIDIDDEIIIINLCVFKLNPKDCSSNCDIIISRDKAYKSGVVGDHLDLHEFDLEDDDQCFEIPLTIPKSQIVSLRYLFPPDIDNISNDTFNGIKVYSSLTNNYIGASNYNLSSNWIWEIHFISSLERKMYPKYANDTSIILCRLQNIATNNFLRFVYDIYNINSSEGYPIISDIEGNDADANSVLRVWYKQESDEFMFESVQYDGYFLCMDYVHGLVASNDYNSGIIQYSFKIIGSKKGELTGEKDEYMQIYEPQMTIQLLSNILSLSKYLDHLLCFKLSKNRILKYFENIQYERDLSQSAAVFNVSWINIDIWNNELLPFITSTNSKINLLLYFYNDCVYDGEQINLYIPGDEIWEFIVYSDNLKGASLSLVLKYYQFGIFGDYDFITKAVETRQHALLKVFLYPKWNISFYGLNPLKMAIMEADVYSMYILNYSRSNSFKINNMFKECYSFILNRLIFNTEYYNKQLFMDQIINIYHLNGNLINKWRGSRLELRSHQSRFFESNNGMAFWSFKSGGYLQSSLENVLCNGETLSFKSVWIPKLQRNETWNENTDHHLFYINILENLRTKEQISYNNWNTVKIHHLNNSIVKIEILVPEIFLCINDQNFVIYSYSSDDIGCLFYLKRN